MQRSFGKNKQKRTGQVRGESVERVNGAPVYTAIYKVNHSDELLEFLLRKCGTSRNNVKSLLVRRQVLVNGSVVTQYNFPLAKDDEVKLSKRPVKEGATLTRPVRERKPTAERKSAPRTVRIIYEDEDFIAIDKPEGLLSVESDKDTECAYGYVLEYMQEHGKNSRPFVLHRIDKETSGVLVFAKNIKLHSMLKMHWNELVSLREYVAVVEGVLEKKQGEIITYLKENKNNVVYSTNDPTGQKAITRYEVLKETEEYSLVKVQIETGRKNQIRVHMQSLGCPVVGDEKYGKKQDGTMVKNPLGRLGLHAARLTFQHPISKEIMMFNASMPHSFRDLFSK
jgi:23S rRNA pseudouridine1911/1915/1917 synthase